MYLEHIMLSFVIQQQCVCVCVCGMQHGLSLWLPAALWCLQSIAQLSRELSCYTHTHTSNTDDTPRGKGRIGDVKDRMRKKAEEKGVKEKEK